MSKRVNSTSEDVDYSARRRYIVEGHPHESAWACASAFYDHFQFKDRGSATDAFRANLRAIDDQWAADFLQELQTPVFREQENLYFQHYSRRKRARSHTMQSVVQHLSHRVQRETLESNAALLLSGNSKLTQVSLAALGTLPSTAVRTPSWHSESDEKSPSPVPFSMPVEEASTVNAEIGVGLCSTPTAQSSKMSLPSTLQSTSLIPSLTLNPQDLSQEDEVESTTPVPAIGIDLEAFARLNQTTSWKEDGFDLLATFHKFKSTHQNAFDLARDDVADLSESSTFVKSLTVPEFRAALKVSSTSISIGERWPMFDAVASRVLQPNSNFDEVYKASREESMLEPVAEYLHDIVHSYGNYFDFHDRIPSGLNEREGFADITWTIIRGALRLAKIESRYLEVPVVGVGERKNAGKNLLLDNKELAHLADGVGFCGVSQIYLAEASVLSNPESRKRLQDEFKVKRDMRDSWVSQMTSLCRQVHPPSGLSVFGSSSFADETRFYKMDFAGVFRLRQINSMLVPLDKVRFGSRLKRCIVACLEVALEISAEQHLIKACSDLAHTSKSPSKEVKIRKSK
ncbi:hypothetical protein BGZ98_009120 [Dissophora globulifera]|nr:hypothetical protein BGZ98_009120 [Dissophora globulifera]